MLRVRDPGCSFLLLLPLLLGSWAEPAAAFTTKLTEDGQPVRWDRQILRFRVDPSLKAFLPNDGVTTAIDIAIDAWRGLPGVPLIIVEEGAPEPLATSSRPATNGIYLVQEWTFEEPRLAVTVARFEARSGRMLDADILINGELPFALLAEKAEPDPDARVYDLAAVLTHEIGHALGLGESPDAPDATMWPRIRPGDTHQRTLNVDDEDGIVGLYAALPALLPSGCGTASVAGGTPRGSTPTLVLSLVFMGSIFFWKRHRSFRRRNAGACS